VAASWERVKYGAFGGEFNTCRTRINELQNKTTFPPLSGLISRARSESRVRSDGLRGPQ
jgi:hypothetical protein